MNEYQLIVVLACAVVAGATTAGAIVYLALRRWS